MNGGEPGGPALPTYDVLPAGALPAGARRAAVLGKPVRHSLSPVLHGAAYAALGLEWVYGLAEVDAHELAGVVASLDAQWAGLSLTMPLKHVALEVADVVDPLAEVVGAVNTLIVQPGPGRGLVVGANTDVHGIVAALREAAGTAGWRPTGAVVLGGGATAASTLAALAELGITDSLVLVRNPARAGALQRAAHRMGVHATLRRWSTVKQAADAVTSADVTVSTLPAGAGDELGDHLASGGGTSGRVLLDVAYDPWPSRLAAGFTAGGGTVAPGWAMLLHQAAEQVRLMTGRAAPLEAMRGALTDALARRGG
ncbi:shikimate dehydrogenase [Georgenia satyanarayanai]|uniref:shikimate dehydrogenase n=1 Tax=Georgenia satyanarayanai TaxID=860221 RepID=UPI0029CA682F|nr:shikimate dehydrogenase [Georgenia satyanarayanai]